MSSNLSTPTRFTNSSRSSPMHWQSQPFQQPCDEEKSFSSISSIYGKNAGVEVKTCASLEEMISVRIPCQNDQWWCILVSSNRNFNFKYFAFVSCISYCFYRSFRVKKYAIHPMTWSFSLPPILICDDSCRFWSRYGKRKM